MVAAQGRWYKDLEREVVKEKCVLCGTCVASCPTSGVKISKEHVVTPYLYRECIACGLCWAFCPRGGLNIKEQELKFTGKTDDAIGKYIKIFSARAKDEDIRKRAQDGGIVSSILLSLFENQEIDAAIVTGAGKMSWKGEPRIISSEKEVLKHSGSIYSQSYVNSLIKPAEEKGYKKLAVVGLPCEIEGARAIKQQNLKHSSYNVKIS